jgi:hypothetical protein
MKTVRLCTYCGRNPATTRDHVPPRSIFPKPLPQNLVTVPACRKCNGGFSDLDDLFALFVSLQAGMVGERQMLLHQKVKRAVKQNRRFQQLLQSASPRIPLLSTDGSISEFVMLLPWEVVPIRHSLERIVAGLAFYHYGVRVSQTGYVSIFYPSPEKMAHPDVAEVLRDCRNSQIGHASEFVYRHARAPDSPNTTIWEFTIYQKFHFVAVTMPLV